MSIALDIASASANGQRVPRKTDWVSVAAPQPPRAQVAGIQRARLLHAAVAAVEELGYGEVSVAHITGRARVSRRTFYELFANREECMAAVLEEVVGRIAQALADADLARLAWRERVRGGLWWVLSFFEREPALARFCFVQSARGGTPVAECREAILARVVASIDEGRGAAAGGAGCSPLTAEGLVGAAVGILHARLLRHEPAPLTDLHGELMGMIALPYLGGVAARRERARPVPAALPAAAFELPERPSAPSGADPLSGVPMRVTYRTARVLEGIAAHPGASNRMVAHYASIHDQGQVSKLLARLRRLGLVDNGDGRGRGEANAWRLTETGEHVARSVRFGADAAGVQPDAPPRGGGEEELERARAMPSAQVCVRAPAAGRVGRAAKQRPAPHAPSSRGRGSAMNETKGSTS
jgi:AcrR family transcriptional regulator